MRTLLYPAVFLLVLWTLALALAAVAHAESFPRQIYVQNVSTSVSDAELENALPAFQAAATFDFAPFWDVNATLTFLPAGMDQPPGAWLILVTDPQSIFYYGYHDLVDGIPYGLVFAELSWQITFTHELFEILGNPYLDRANRVQRRLYPFYVQETADPVEADQFAYSRPSLDGTEIPISDFVTPAWFRAGSKGPWDFTEKTKRPLQILHGGYQIAWSAKKKKWMDLCYGNKLCAGRSEH